jgi:hypothetical protein
VRTLKVTAGGMALAAAVVLAALPGSASADGPVLSPHYSGKGLLNPDADLSVSPAQRSAALPAAALPADLLARTAQRFNTWSGYPTGRTPEAVATGDFDADGDADVAFARGVSAAAMTVELNKGDGTMQTPTSYPASAGSNDIKAGDLDGDLDLDLAVVSSGTTYRNTVIDLYLNDGTAEFTHRTATGGVGPKKMALADLDGDGDLDIAMTSGLFLDLMSVVLNKGDATFDAERRYTVGKEPTGIAAGDFDRDGDVDLAVGRDDPESLDTTVQIWVNNGSAKFTTKSVVLLEQHGDPSLVADDFNADGKIDLAVGLTGGDAQMVLINRGRLTFDQTSYETGFTAWDLTAGDLDGDGDHDIVLATTGSSSTGDMSILRNRGRGSFEPLRFSSGFNPHDAAIADFDDDGKADIVVAQAGTETGSIHLQRAHFRFGPPDLAETDLLVGSVEHSDVDHDGDLDLTIAINDPYGGIGYVQVMENNGKAVFSPGQVLEAGLTSEGHVGHVQPADLNGDGWDDMVWSLNQFSEPVGPIVTSLNDGTGHFGPAVVFPGTARNDFVAVGDLDDDGDLDLASAQFTQQIAVYLNRGDATFGAARLLPVAEFPGMVIASDLSGDGLVDLATVHNGVYGSSKAISVLIGTGDARFAAPVTYEVGQGPIEIVATDLDDDGDLDLVTSNNGGDDTSTFAPESTTVLINKGNGKLGPITTYAGEVINYYLSQWAIAAADIDGDGHMDIVVSNVLGNDAGVYYGKGDGTLQPQQVRYGLQNGAQDLTVADFNGDGRPDIAAAGYLQSVDPLFPPAGIVVLKNQGKKLA